MLGVTLNVLNQKGAPALYEDIAANRPAAGFTGRLFVSTDTLLLQRDTGIAWQTIAGGGSSIGGSIAANQVAYGSGANTIVGSNNFTYNSITGILNVAGAVNAISVTLSGLTAGQVVYTGASGLLSSAANFAWDNTNNILGLNGSFKISYSSSVYSTQSYSNTNVLGMTANGYANALSIDLSKGSISLANPLNQNTSLTTYTTATLGGYTGIVQFNQARGTVGSPATILTGDGLGLINFSAYTSTAGSYKLSAQIQAIANGTVTTNGYFPADLQFVTRNSNEILAVRMTINSAGNLLLGSNTDNTAGIIQAAGNIVPSINNTNSIGTSSYYWNYVYSNKGSFSNSQNISAGGASVVSHVGTFTDIGTGLTGGVSVYAALSEMAYTTTASRTIAATNVYAGALNILYLSVTGSSTVAVSNSGSNIRAMYATFSQVNIGVNAATTSSITSVAAIATQLYSDTVHQLSIGTYYAVLITDSTQFYSGNVTNRWGLYQEGASDINFINGELRMGSGQTISASVLNTVTNKVKLIINGTTYYLLASTSGV